MAELGVQQMAELATPQAGRQVAMAIAEASARTGVDFSYMLAKAGVESGFDADAGASTSSAKGLYQFIDSTWLSMVKRHGADHGLQAQADAIRFNRSGQAYVADRQMRREILALRDNPQIAALMAAEFAKENEALLAQEYSGPIGDIELYMAHFLGPRGAAKFLNAWQANPNQSSAALFPKAARANRPVFYHPSGAQRTLQSTRDWIADRLAVYDPSAAMREVAAEVTVSVRQSAAGLGAAAAIHMQVGAPAVRAAPQTPATAQPGQIPPSATVSMVTAPAQPAPAFADRAQQPGAPASLPALSLETTVPATDQAGQIAGGFRVDADRLAAQAPGVPPQLRPFTTLSPETVLMLATLYAPGEEPKTAHTQ